MTLYLAAPWSFRKRMPAIAARFVAAGHAITETWWHAPDTSDVIALRQNAAHDLAGVLAADALVLINAQPRGKETSGKAVETGVALAAYKPIVLIGTPSNIFHHLPPVVIVATVDDALTALTRVR